MRKNREDTNAYQRKWYQARKEKSVAVDKITSSTPCQFYKLAFIGIAIAIVMSGVSLWLSWRAYDISQWIAGH